jgi:hypothetical protein
VATGRKWHRRGNARNKPKPLPAVATSRRMKRMVRRGSTVRVRQRALQKSRKRRLFLSSELAGAPVCGGYGAVYGAFRSGSRSKDALAASSSPVASPLLLERPLTRQLGPHQGRPGRSSTRNRPGTKQSTIVRARLLTRMVSAVLTLAPAVRAASMTYARMNSATNAATTGRTHCASSSVAEDAHVGLTRSLPYVQRSSSAR